MRNNKSYVGMTRNTIEQRVQEHLDLETDVINKFDGIWTHSQLAKIKYFDDRDLRKLEKKYINLRIEEGDQLINTQNMPKEKRVFEVNVCVSYEDKLKERVNINESSHCFRIKCKIDDENIDVIKKWGSRISKKQAKD